MPKAQEVEAPKDHAPVAAAPKKRHPMAIVATIGTVGVAIVALNTFTGLNFRPAWAYETEQLAAVDADVIERLDKMLLIQDSTSKNMLRLNKGQYQLRLHQIDREKRELRRELAEHQSRAQEFRDNSETVPSWLRDSIADTTTSIDELTAERRTVENKLLELGE